MAGLDDMVYSLLGAPHYCDHKNYRFALLFAIKIHAVVRERQQEDHAIHMQKQALGRNF
jgi:hypothetical protein